MVDGRDRANLMTANLVMQVAVDPKLVAVAVDATAVTAGLVRAGGRFTVNLLHREDRAVVRRFVKPVTEVARGEDGRLRAMAGHPVEEGLGGVPVLRGALAVLECALRQAPALGSHVLFVGEVVNVIAPDDGGHGSAAEVLRMEDTRMSYGG